MFKSSSAAIQATISCLVDAHSESAPICIAVAFWGSGAEDLLAPDKSYKIICNLTAGGTNPAVIETLMRRRQVEVRHLRTLHAKVTIAEGGAVIASANFSANGLGFWGPGAEPWDEAGYFISAGDSNYVAVRDWFWAM